MDKSECPPRPTNWSGWMAVVVYLVMQTVIGAIWVGSIQTRTEVNSKWIESRSMVNIDSRLAVCENRLDNLTQEFQLHIQNDADRERSFRQK